MSCPHLFHREPSQRRLEPVDGFGELGSVLLLLKGGCACAVVPAAHGQPPDFECFRCIDAPQLTSRHTSKVDWLCAAAGGVAFVVVADPAVCMAQRIMQRVILIVWAVLLWSFAATLALVGSTAPSYHRYQPRSFLCCAIQAVQPALWVFVGCERTRTWHSPCTLRRQQAAFPGMFFCACLCD